MPTKLETLSTKQLTATGGWHHWSARHNPYAAAYYAQRAAFFGAPPFGGAPPFVGAPPFGFPTPHGTFEAHWNWR